MELATRAKVLCVRGPVAPPHARPWRCREDAPRGGYKARQVERGFWAVKNGEHAPVGRLTACELKV